MFFNSLGAATLRTSFGGLHDGFITFGIYFLETLILLARLIVVEEGIAIEAVELFAAATFPLWVFA